MNPAPQASQRPASSRYPRLRLVLVFAVAWCSLAALSGVVAAEPVLRYPQVTQPAAWQPQPEGSEATLTEVGGFLKLSFPGDANVRLELKEPIALSEGVRDLAFSCTNNGTNQRVKILLLLRDAAGVEFAFYTRGDMQMKTEEAEFGVVQAGHRTTEARHHTPAFTYAYAGRTLRTSKPGAKPKLPLTWIGLQVEARYYTDKKTPEYYFRDFVSSELTPRESTLHYQFNDRECLGEVDGLPYLTFGEFWWWPGTYRVSWDVRADYAGQPFLTGSDEIVATEDGELPLAVQLAKHIEIPVREVGTYWVRARVCRTDPWNRFTYYKRVEEREYRLDIIRGAPAIAQRTPAPRDARTFVRIAPQRDSLVFEAAEPFVLPVEFTRPQAADRPASVPEPVAGTAAAGKGQGQGYTMRLLVQSSTMGVELLRLETTPNWDANGVWTLNVDLGDPPPGGYRVDATLVDPAGHDFDFTRRLIARRQAVGEALAPIPDSVVSAKALLASKTPMFHLDATYEHDAWVEDPQMVWDTAMRPFMDEAAKVSRDIELTVYWNSVEPVPGVYDWRDVDRFLDYAQSKRLRVLLRLDFRGNAVPEWVPPQFVQNREGHVFGHTAYLFHGMQPNSFASPELRAVIQRYFTAAVEHFRGHPAVQGYYWVAEHGGDSPWSGFIGGFAPETLGYFHTWLQARYPDVATANAAWGTDYATWDAVEPPAEEGASDRYRLDWLRFRSDTMESAKRDFVTNTRAIDPVRLLMIYSTQADAAWFAERGVMTANGGSHDAFMPTYLGLALDGFQMRNEEITPRFWSGSGPYQLAATVFHASYAGGAHAHCKAFIATWKRFAECQDAPYSLAAYTDFQRIWRELRQTETMPVETFIFADDTSYKLARDDMGGSASAGGWPVESYLAAHLQPALAGPKHWQKGKFLLATTDFVTTLEDETIDQLVAYVESGGTLYMRADTGRYSLERPNEDWLLLKRFGLTPPGDFKKDQYVFATSTDGERYRLRDMWITPAQGETIASFENGDTPAVSRVAFCKGVLFVRWCQSEIPPTKESVDSLTGKVAALAGIDRYAMADSPNIWTYILKHQQKKVWYGMVYSGPWNKRQERGTETGHVWWPKLPDGTYQITELIHQTDLGEHDAESLRTVGLDVKLEPREVAIYRLELK